jgi:hypothetical protein
VDGAVMVNNPSLMAVTMTMSEQVRTGWLHTYCIHLLVDAHQMIVM